MDILISLRLTPSLMERIDQLTKTLQDNPSLAPELAERGRITRTAVIREAIVQGLTVMDKRIQQKSE